ncbi:MAG: hypothetical protein M3Y27_24620 [Acidobacteriota bacterium]|nr:hypothetical protein [Acidobacteriota bacterium]
MHARQSSHLFHEPASPALAAQMLNERVTKIRQSGPDCDAGNNPDPEIDCVAW